ncbi:hypothetical protein [Stenotrophomonas maltophilia]|uniref:hypothetical protein n=1 Tax=Stenotrophomonas maltophilia TaxID=40324 RepID=UPI0039C0FE32
MNTDNKTLADAQPGGRVRLGDGLPPLPKAGYVTGGDFGHEAHNAFTPEQMREYALAALSAQPSPGGQGDARALIQRYDAAGAKFRESLMDDHYSDAQRVEFRRALSEAQDELIAALTARQPVGEPVTVPGAPTSCRHCDSTDLKWFAHVRTLNDVQQGRLNTHDVGCVFVLGCEECSETLRVVKADDIAALLNAAPPVHARDLGQIWQQAFNDTAHSYRRNKSRMWVLKILKERVQALIDSQAVGNGN